LDPETTVYRAPREARTQSSFNYRPKPTGETLLTMTMTALPPGGR